MTPAYRQQYCSVNPAGIIAPAIVATFISTAVAVYIFVCIDTFGSEYKVTSGFFARSTNVNLFRVQSALEKELAFITLADIKQDKEKYLS